VETGDKLRTQSMECKDAEDLDNKPTEATTQDMNVVCDTVTGTGVVDNDSDSVDDNSNNDV